MASGAFSIELIRNGDIVREVNQRVANFQRMLAASAAEGARAATDRTRSSFRAIRPDNAPSRPGRPNNGRMVDSLMWVVDGDGVSFDIAKADADVPYWIIQEIGTGHSATMLTPQVPNPRGRAAAGATYVRTVPSQIGRLIPASLAFGTGPSGSYTAPGAAGGQQLYLRRKLKGAPTRSPRDSVVISREIKGQHMVRQGGEAGFSAYRVSAIAAARQAFQGRPFTP